MLDVERWIAWVRLGAVAFVALEVGLFTESFPDGYERMAWALTIAFGAGAILLFLATDPEVCARLSRPALEAMFDESYHFKHVDTIFRRVFGRA